MKDPQDHFLLLKGQIGTFVFYYAPNKAQAPFLTNMFRSLSQHFEGTVLCGGDLNLTLDVSLDKSRPLGTQLHVPVKASLCLAKLLHSLNLTDLWQEKHPTMRDFTH